MESAPNLKMTKKLNFYIIFNVNAVSEKKLKLINKVIFLLKKRHSVEFFKTNSEKDAVMVFKNLSNKDVDRIVIAGGDGSICFGINQIINQYKDNSKPLIGYIPAGTANILQIEMQMEKKAEEIYKTLVSENSKKINLVKINESYFFLMAGIGFDSEIVRSINTNKKKYLGKIIFALKSLQHFIFLKYITMEVEINGQVINADWVLVTNSKYYAGPHSITKQTNIFNQKVIVYIFKDLTRIKLLHYLWLILAKKDLSPAKSVITKELSVLKINKIGGKILSQIDGENFGFKDRLVIKKTNKYINLLVP
jgi:diacylglycerol kinase family enzyme